MSIVQTPWTTVRQAAVCVRTRDRYSDKYVYRTAGFLHDRGKYFEFSYCPDYLMGDPDSLPLDPFHLPMVAMVWRSKTYAFDGDLQMFRYLLPGDQAEGASFLWLSEKLMEASSMRVPPSRSSYPMPTTPLTRLVWATFAATFEQGVNGMRFMPHIEYPKDKDRGWMPEPNYISGLEIEAWREISRKYPARVREPSGQYIHHYKMFSAGQQDVPLEVLRGILPWNTSSSLRVRNDTAGIPAVFDIDQTARGTSGIRKVRCKAAVLELAKACGLDVAERTFFPEDEKKPDVLRIVQQPNRLIIPVAPHPPRVEVVRVDNSSPDPWLADTSHSDVYCGQTPWMMLMRIYNYMRRKGIPFDPLECYRRICFSKICGHYPVDDTPIGLSPLRKPDGVFGLFKGYPTVWKLAPITTLNPMLLPNKTALAMASGNRLLKECAVVAFEMKIERRIAEGELKRVLAGAEEWRRIADQHNLDHYESWGFCPAVVNSRERVGLGDNEKRKMIIVPDEGLNKKRRGSGDGQR